MYQESAYLDIAFVVLLSVMRLSPLVLRPQIGLLCELRMTDECGTYV